MNFKLLKKTNLILLVLFFSISAFAQTTEDAIKAFNTGVTLANEKNYTDAISSYQKCIGIFDEIGENENAQRVQAAGQIPALQYKQAISLYKQKKSDESIKAFYTLIDYSKKYENAKYQKKAENIIPKLYYTKGKNELTAKNYELAITNLNKAIELKPSYGMAYVRLAMVYQAQENTEKFTDAIDKSIATNNTKSVDAAKNLASNYFSNAANTALASGKYTEAENLFNTLLKYQDITCEIEYNLALIYNKQSKWDEAITACNKALELFVAEGTTKDAKIYFELGNAYKGKGDNTAACDAYKKAAKGDYEEAANYEIKYTLKCK